MPKQALVIGLGQFGQSLVRSLSQRNIEVLAVDTDARLVQSVASIAARAVAFDATLEEELARTEPRKRDFCIVAIGEESRDASILCTALLRQLGAPWVLARATDPLHERILRLVGAHEVVNPESAFGERLATRLAYHGIVDEFPLGGDLVITEVRAPTAMVGQSLADLELPRRHGLTVVAIRRMEQGEGALVLPSPRLPIRPQDILVVVGKPGAARTLLDGI
jgi:trk system potassium uptake protein TrkA